VSAFKTFSALLLLFFAGCATNAMKGTPFYTGEWEERTGPVEDRVALWPLVYYRASASLFLGRKTFCGLSRVLAVGQTLQ